MKKCLSALIPGKIMASSWAWAQSDTITADSIPATVESIPAIAEPVPSMASPIPAMAEWPGLVDMAWVGAALILVLALLVLLLKALQRVGRFKAGRGALFEVRGYQPLDNRKYLTAVAVGGRMLIIGVTPDRLIPLGQWMLLDEEDQGKGLFSVNGPDLDPEPPETEDAPPDISVVGPEESRR